MQKVSQSKQSKKNLSMLMKALKLSKHSNQHKLRSSNQMKFSAKAKLRMWTIPLILKLWIFLQIKAKLELKWKISRQIRKIKLLTMVVQAVNVNLKSQHQCTMMRFKDLIHKILSSNQVLAVKIRTIMYIDPLRSTRQLIVRVWYSVAENLKFQLMVHLK